MDSTKPSLSSKSPHVNSGGGNESPMDEGLVPRRDSVDGGRQRDSESRETDVVDGLAAVAEINYNHKGSDKHKFNSMSYQRRTKQKVVTDFTLVGKGTSAGVKPRAALRQVLFSQGGSDKNLASEERGQLDVLKQELEAFAVPISLKWRWKEESQGTTLEKNWTDIVHSHSTMSKMQRHQQEALWELVTTELTYINKLIIMRDLVIAALINLHQRGFLLEVTPELLFSNLPSILSAHQLFWQEVIYPMLNEVRRTGKPFEPMRLEAGCLQFHERFSTYRHYCWEEENTLEFTRRQMESNPHFLTFVQWVETHPQCERMRLGDMQAKPHQRITKYPLLLMAVLKRTQDPHVQQILKGMLSSVNSFVESINDYLTFKDAELALSISGQRVEGYEVEGINEEVDKYIREVCRFDLTCPITGVGPDNIRKLLLEENLKIRDRKESKLELVTLLFSDVLLLTKAQKKGERLRVVRPPLALEKTSCMALKDGCSFVLVEVGELQSVMNVYIFATSTSERCSTWVTAIHMAKENLAKMRKIESKRQMENWKIQLEAKLSEEAKTEDMEMEEQPPAQSGEKTFVGELIEEPFIPKSINGMLASKAESEQRYQNSDDVATNNAGLAFWQMQPADTNQKPMHKGFADQKQPVRGHEWIEMKRRGQQDGNCSEEEGKIVESQITWDRREAFCHRTQSAPNLDLFTPNTARGPSRYNTTEAHYLLLGGLPDIDYPTNDENTLQLPHQPVKSKDGPQFQRVPWEVTSVRNDFQAVIHDMRRHSSYNQSGETETAREGWGFSKQLKSPGLRRRKPSSVQHGPSTQSSKQFLHGSGEAALHDSSSNSDSDYNQNIKSNSLPSSQSSDSFRVLKLGSLRPNQGMFWNMNDRNSPDPQTMSESELLDVNSHSKWTKVKTQRSASIPNIGTEGGHGVRLHSSSLHTSSQDRASPISGQYPNGHSSPLEALLKKAKERVKEQDGIKREQSLKMANLRLRYPPSSPLFSTTPSPSPSDGDREPEWEGAVAVRRHRALTVSKGWKEQLVDGDEDDNRSSILYTEGVNVDWPGWCFDDDEVLDHLCTEDEGLMEGIRQSLSCWDFHDFSEHEEGECSQV